MKVQHRSAFLLIACLASLLQLSTVLAPFLPSLQWQNSASEPEEHFAEVNFTSLNESSTLPVSERIAL